ncbi:uncharacterized protein GGS22DRAFT_58422 [Annulohypoxylon maeteangense]|uniref:uncharacterized protein n=1 Tax=Annulohypoxylon maeteangense TaxID=1927788 RepID=UPI00200780D2|nr:uncharacterized protein GGS22DRAFT_58422 [Annulohypoxylon maeteangense]KAI0881468.1 hypothetical protein GGS22DRAFT_58422 [Annulohypoxylon maeteangense]
MLPRVLALGNDPWDPTNRFVTSWLISPYVLAAVRALFSLYAFLTLLFNIGYQCARPDIGGCEASRASFSYFTVLTYWGLAFYLAFAAVHTFTYARYGAPLLARWPRSLQALHALFYSSVTSYPFLVTIVYWGVIYSYGSAWFPTIYGGWSNISQHALNSFFALFEIFIPRTEPQPWIHVLWLIVMLALYLALAYLTHATKGFYTYSFLDPGKQGSLVAAYVFGIAVAAVLIFGIVKFLIWGRRYVTEEKMGKKGKFMFRSEAEGVEMVGPEAFAGK